ncbi:hypothetical protein TrVE_jg7604 [Triparma verrucosa]|uniref:Methyltransferase type 11 domain-containing protein n=1 Tax=Triparma verrucosa TaxID=1606542 RepID=A0A9W7BUE9_9STRA|nr:hypothetical protein TrVE_jg7604 [Triparma verrucosa]
MALTDAVEAAAVNKPLGEATLISMAELASHSVDASQIEKLNRYSAESLHELADMKATLIDNLQYSESGLALLLLIFDCERSGGVLSNVGCNIAGLLAHLQPQNENAVLFVTRHLSEKEENDTTCWYLLTSCFAKSSHEGVRSKTISALHDLSTKLKTPSAQARCSHLLAILTQSGASASRGSHEYVKAVFDDLAPVFESRLIDTLGYRVPWILHERVEEHFRSNDSHLVTEYVNKSLSIIDLGCGTGLVGKCFSNLVRDKCSERLILSADHSETATQISRLQSSIIEMNTLDPSHQDSDFNDARRENLTVIEKCQSYLNVIEGKLKDLDARGIEGLYGPIKGKMIGCDVSPNMCKEADKTGAYSEKVCGEDCDLFLQKQDESSFHIVVSADTYIYLGDLRVNFEAAYRALVVGGLLAFSVELIGDEEEEKGFRLLDSGRYGQSSKYIKELASSVGFDIAKEEDIVVRKEQASDIHGAVFILVKSEQK